MTTDPKSDGELQGDEYVATPEELQAIDAAIASIDAGETVSAAEIKAVFAKFRQTLAPDVKNDIFQQ
jgi:hypothetical protein